MPRRPAVLPTFPRDLSNFALSGILVQRSEAHPFTFQSLAHSLQKPGGVTQSVFSTSRFFPTFNLQTCELSNALCPLSATLTADLRVLPCFGRDRPSATPLDATLTDLAPVTPLSATLTKNVGVGAMPANPSASPASRMLHALCLWFAGPDRAGARGRRLPWTPPLHPCGAMLSTAPAEPPDRAGYPAPESS